MLQKEENGVMRLGKEEMESGGSGSELQLDEKSVNETLEGSEPQQPNARKKRYHRHTARQIQEMEAYACSLLLSTPAKTSYH